MKTLNSLLFLLSLLFLPLMGSADDLSVERVKLGMTSRQVIGELGSAYSMVDLICDSVGEGEDYSLLFRKGGPQEIDVTFTFGRVSSIEGYRLTYNGKSLVTGDSRQKILAVFGPPRDKDSESLAYWVRSVQAKVIFRLKQNKLKSIILENH